MAEERGTIEGMRGKDPVIAAFEALSAKAREVAAATIRQLAEAEGISVPEAPQWLKRPADGIPLWVAKLKGERYSPRTIYMYRYRAERYLEGDPAPTKLGVQKYLADRLEAVSPATVGNELKALKSLFKFLREEGLWPSNPIAKIGHIKVRYSEKQPPEVDDVLKVLGGRHMRQGDADKLIALVILLGTTGLRVSEAAGLLKRSVDLGRGEIRVVGKGDKPRMVPLLPVTAGALEAYVAKHPNDTPFVWPGRTKTGHCDIHNLEKTLRHACLRAGVRPFSPHGLRHFFATEALRDGAKLEVISKILGHSGVGITADVYRSVRPSEMRDEMLAHAPLNGGFKALPAGEPNRFKSS